MSSSRVAELTCATVALGLWSALLVGPIADALSPSRAEPAAPAVTGAESMARPEPGVRRTLQAQTASAGVSGRVVDATGRPVAGVVIFLRELATETPIGWLRAITDAAGNFQVSGLLPGFYSLIALDGDSHGTASERLPLLADATARLQLILSEPITI